MTTACAETNATTAHFARTVGDILPCGHEAIRASDSSLVCGATTADVEAGMALLFPHLPARLLDLFSQRQPAASAASKGLLRRLLAEKAAAHPEEVRLLRAFFNDHRTTGETIWQVHVSGAIAYLKSL